MRSSGFLLLLIFFANSVFAQQVTYRVVDNNPNNIKSVYVGANLFTVDGNMTSLFNFALGAEAHAILFDRVLAHGMFDHFYFHDTKPPEWLLDMADLNKPNYQIEDNSMYSFEVGGGLILYDVISQGTTNIVLSSTSSSVTSINVPSRVRKAHIVRGGIIGNRIPFDVGEVSERMANANVGAGGNFGVKDAASAVSFTGFYGGYAYFKGYNLRVDAHGYGTRSLARFSYFYVDYIHAADVSIENYTINNTIYVIENWDNGFTEQSSGWRFGYYMQGATRRNTSMRIEVGNMPGIAYDGIYDLYASFRFGYNFGFF